MFSELAITLAMFHIVNESVCPKIGRRNPTALALLQFNDKAHQQCRGNIISRKHKPLFLPGQTMGYCFFLKLSEGFP